MVQVTHVRMSEGGTRHEHIASVSWLNPESGKTGTSTVPAMVEYIHAGNRVYTCDGHRVAVIRVVDANPPYIRTYADNSWTDNLLSLPKF